MGYAFGLLVIVSFIFKPLLVPDETRYLAVAWEMWREGNFLVPKLNGEFYTHKPPFLFWLMHLGWSVFGVNSWWPRLLAPLALLLNAFLLRRLGGKLFPDRPELGSRASLLFLGTFFPVLFMTQIMFDLWVVAWVLLGLTALVDAHKGSSLVRTSFMASLALGLGIVCKGPVLLLYLLPPALAARHWSDASKRVFLTGMFGLLGGAALALAWAIPAGIAGGEAYREAIFWGQTAGRMKDSFDHARPIWWYLPLLPLMLYPWIWWRNSYLGWGAVRRQDGWLLRLTLWAVVPQLLVFSVISGKQPHYLLPLFPMLLVALSRKLDGEASPAREGQPNKLRDFPWTMVFPGILALALMTAWLWWSEEKRPDWAQPLGMILPGVFLLIHTWKAHMENRAEGIPVLPLAFQTPFLVCGILWALGFGFKEAYDIRPVSALAAELETDQRPMAFYGSEYAGQFHFHGRLSQPLSNPHNERDLIAWLDANPDGVLFQVIRRGAEDHPYGYSRTLHRLPLEFGSRRIQLWDAAALRAVLADRGH